MAFGDNRFNYNYQYRRKKQEPDYNINKTAKKNFLRSFIFLCILMLIFSVLGRIANAEKKYFVSYPLSPDTDTKIKLEWQSVPAAKQYHIFRDDGTGLRLVKVIDVDTDLDTLTYVDEGLKPGTTYTHVLKAYDEQMRELTVQDNTTVTVTSPMIRPYGLKAIYDINTKTAILTWNSSALAEGSRINRNDGGAVSYRDVAETTTAEEMITGSSTVRFTVQTLAQSAGYGISAASDTIGVFPVPVPTLSAEYVNDGTVRVSWDTQSYINVFVLECSKWEGTSWSAWETVNSSLSGSNTTCAVDEGGKYRFRLRAREDRGYRGYSNITDYVNNLAAPTELAGQITDKNRIDLTWKNARGNEGKIQVWRKDGGSAEGQYTLLATLESNVNTYTDRFAILTGATYHYRVNAVDDAGHYSSYASVSVSAVTPAAPTLLRASAETGSGITLTWNDNSNNEIGFSIERFDETQIKFVSIGVVGSNTVTYTDNTAVQGNSYIYRVCAYNGIGKSGYTNEVTVNSWDTAAPASLIVTSVSATRLDLSWSYTGSENYNTIIERKTGAEGTWTPIFTTAVGVLKYSDTGLQPGTRYFYRVRKSLGTGVSGAPYPSESGVGAYTKLATPMLSAVASYDNSIYLKWSNVSGADVVIERKMSNGVFSAIMTVGPSSNGWYDNTGLVPGAFYTYRIKAKTATNESLYSEEITVQNYYVKAPSSLTISVEKDKGIVLKWYDTTLDEAGFEIWRYAHNSGGFVLLDSVDRNITTYTDTRVEKGIQYSYKVRAFTATGVYSDFSNTVSAGVGLINPPANLKYSYISESQVLLEWTDTSDNEYGFIIEMKAGDDGEWIEKGSVSANKTSYTVSNLNKYTKYYFRVKAYNYTKDSESVSEEILVTTAAPAKPSDLSAVSMSASQVKITWKDNSDLESGFKIYRSLYSNRLFTLIGETTENTTIYYDNSVAAGKRYYYKVAAFNKAGVSESGVVGVTTNTKVHFSDTKGVPWAEEAIENLAGMGIIKGVSGTLFKPGNTITKAEFAAIVVRAFGLETAPVGSLADVKYDKWYYREVMIAENFGIISGDKDNRFYPEKPVTREEMAVMVFRALQASGRKFTVHDNSVLEKYIDKQNISPNAVSAMAVLVGEGIIEGLQGNTIGPKYTATRAQAAVIIYRALMKTEPGSTE